MCRGFIVLIVLLAGCTGVPEEAFRLPQSSLAAREMQSYSFEVKDEAEILAASVALLQDMEYNLDAVERPLGVLTASKVVDVDSMSQKVGLIALDIVMALLSAVGGGSSGGSAYAGADDEVALELTLVVLPSLEKAGEYVARVSIQSTLYDKSERIKTVGTVEDAEVYEEIFAKLSKAIFLEEEDL